MRDIPAFLTLVLEQRNIMENILNVILGGHNKIAMRIAIMLHSSHTQKINSRKFLDW